jgi:hypothetical protein
VGIIEGKPIVVTDANLHICVSECASGSCSFAIGS